jgi:hypothetical protein
MAAKKGSVEAFKQAEAERQERLKTKNKSGNKLPERIQKSREEFNTKVKKINESRVDQGSVARFKKAEEERKARVASFKSNQKPIDPVKRKEARSGNSNTAVKTAATVGAASASGDAIAKPKAVSTTDKGIAAAGSFAEAFKKARSTGEGTKFAYNDKMYAAVTKDDVSRAGKTDLKDYLNSLSRKDNTKIAKAPGQMSDTFKKGGSVMARGCKLGRTKPTKMY